MRKALLLSSLTCGTERASAEASCASAEAVDGGRAATAAQGDGAELAGLP